MITRGMATLTNPSPSVSEATQDAPSNDWHRWEKLDQLYHQVILTSVLILEEDDLQGTGLNWKMWLRNRPSFWLL